MPSADLTARQVALAGVLLQRHIRRRGLRLAGSLMQSVERIEHRLALAASLPLLRIERLDWQLAGWLGTLVVRDPSQTPVVRLPVRVPAVRTGG